MTAVEEKGRRSVWSINTEGQYDAHYAAFPEKLCKIPIQAACPPDTRVVLDPFAGRGTVGILALKLARNFIGIDLNPEYVELARKNFEPLMMQDNLGRFLH
jgi:DNA modification methylase